MMNKLLQQPIALLVIASIGLWLLYSTTTTVNYHLSTITVYPADPHPSALSAGQVSPNLQKLYPLVAHATRKASPAEDAAVDINAAFVMPVRKEDTKPVVPDYFKALQDNRLLKLNAVSDNGAIINGAFVPFDSTIDAFAYPLGLGPKTTAPRLARGTDTATVIVREFPGHRSYILPQK